MGITIQPAAYAYHRRNGDFPAAWAAMNPWAMKQSISRPTTVATPSRYTMDGNVYAGPCRSGTPTAWLINAGQDWNVYQGDIGRPNSGTCRETPFIICVTYDKFANIPASNVSTWRELGVNYDKTAWGIFGLTNRAIIPDAMANYVYVTGIYVFDNSNDGNYSANNPRTELNGYDIFTPVHITEIKTYQNNGAVFTSAANSQLFLSLTNVIAPFFSGRQQFHGDQSKFNVMAPATADMKIPMSKMVQVVGMDSLGDTACRATLYPTVDDLRRDLYGWGVPFTFDYNAALYSNTSEFTDDPGDGTPPNPFGGGGGNGDNFNDPIPFPDTPFSPASLGGYLTLVQSPDELKKLTSVLWKPVIRDLSDALKVYFNTDNLTNSVLSIMYYPVDLASMPLGLTHSDSIRIAWSDDNISADIMANNVSHEIDAGYYDFAEYYGSFLDYAPYTTADIWLPYIGYKPLEIDAVMGKRVNVKYYIDFIYGLATAVIFADNRPINTYTGQLAVDLAVTGRDYANKLRQTVDAGLSMVTGVNKSIGSVSQGAAAVLAKDAGGIANAAGGLVGNFSSGALAGGQAVMQQAQTVTYGTAGGENWLSMPQRCHIKFTRAVAASPASYIDEMGYPTTYTATVSKFAGYLKCAAVFGDFSGIPADDADEIETLLKTGVQIKSGVFG